MRYVLAFTLCALAAPAAFAQAPAPAPGTPEAAASVEPVNTDEPTLEEKRLVAYVATGVSVASLVSGITFGLLAQTEFDCAKDVVACNKNLNNKIVGAELFDVRSEIEQKALAADMSYLFAVASGVVATAGYLAGFVFVDESEATASLPPPVQVTPIRLAKVTQ